MLEIPLAVIVSWSEAELCLLLAIERHRLGERVAAVTRIDAIDHRSMIGGQGEQGADSIHADEHSNSPSAENRRADI